MPDVLQDRRPGGYADAGTDEDSDLVLENVFCGSSVRPVDAQLRHHLPVLEGNFVHPHRVKAFQILGLGRSTSERVPQAASEIAYLTDMYADVGIEWAGCDREWVPLSGRDFGDLDEEPLPGFVFHAWLAELDLHCI